MKKLLLIAITAMVLAAFASVAQATIQVTTQTPDIFYAGTRERPSGIQYSVTDSVDFAPTVTGFPAPSYYYGYIRLLRNATLAVNIGTVPVGVGYDAATHTITGPINTIGFEGLTYPAGANNGVVVDSIPVAPSTQSHLQVTTSAAWTVGANNLFGIWGIKGADFLIYRVPAPATNTLSPATLPLQILIRNLCVNMATSTGPAYGPNEFLAAIVAHSNPDVLLNQYPATATRNNDIANYNPIPFNIAFTGQGTNYTLREVLCPKNFNANIASSCPQSVTAVDPVSSFGGIPLCVIDTQAACPYFTKCFVIDRIETSGNTDITLNSNRITINPSDYVYPQCLSVFYTTNDSDAAAAGDFAPVTVTAAGANPVYTCKQVASPLDFTWTQTFTTGASAKRLLVYLVYTVYQPGLQLNVPLSVNVTVETDIATECGGQTGALSVALGNTVACNAGTKTIWFPYVIIKKADWVTGIAITNLTPATVSAANMSVTYTLYDKNGVANTKTVTGFPGTTYEFIVDSWIVDTFGQAAFDALPSESAGWLNLKANFSIDGFIFYTDGNFGAGSWPRP